MKIQIYIFIPSFHQTSAKYAYNNNRNVILVLLQRKKATRTGAWEDKTAIKFKTQICVLDIYINVIDVKETASLYTK